MWTGRKVAFLTVVMAVGLVIWFLATPYLTLARVRAAIQEGDEERLIRYIDFFALQEDIQTRLMASIDQARTRSTGERLESAIESVIVGSTVDALSSPQAIGAMIQGVSPDLGLEPKPEGLPAPKPEDLDVWMGYEAHDRFVMITKNRLKPDDQMAFVFARHGLSWKLTGVRLNLQNPSVPVNNN